MYNISQLKNYAIILKSGKETFWASDFGFKGGDINGLCRDFISPTGKTKEVLVPIGNGDLYKKVEVKEWRVRRFDDTKRQELWQKIVDEELRKTVKLLCFTADLYRDLGY